MWFKKDVNHPLLIVADENNCANRELWGYKYIDFTWTDKPSLNIIKERVFGLLKYILGSDFEDKLYRFEKTIHVKQFYQGTLNHAYAIHNNEKIKIDDSIVSNKVCEIWCEANWNGRTGTWETSVENMEIKNYQHVSAGCPYYHNIPWLDWSFRIVGAEIGLPFILKSNFIHQYLAKDE